MNARKIGLGVLALGLAFLLVACSSASINEPTENMGQQAAALSGSWTPLNNPTPANLDTCLLLTTGEVMCHQYLSNAWHKLTPDAFGSYQNGTWDGPSGPPATMPNGNDPSFGCNNCEYAPLYFSSAVLPDGRMIVIGGEDNGNLSPVWTNIGFIYDPVADAWSSQLTEAFGGGNVGDAQNVILQDGTFLLANTALNSTNLEALNAATGVFTARNPTGKRDMNDEENWNILADGTVLTVDANTASSFEKYFPSTNTWGSGGSTPVNMADFGPGTGNTTPGNTGEIGPCVGRPDKTLMCFSGNPFGQNALYTPSTNTWLHTASMDFPAAPISGSFAVADGPAAALPNGNILVMASPVTTNSFGSGPLPSHFYELVESNNTLTQVTDSPNAASFASYQGRMLVLPTGQVLLTAYNQGHGGTNIQDVALYSNGAGPASSSRPIIISSPNTIAAGGVYTISGAVFNGFSQGASYGDDAQSATNYPLVRITNKASGHVYYARTFNHSRMGIEAPQTSPVVTTSFQVPASLENGPVQIEVVANGIASTPVIANTKFTNLTLLNGWVGGANNSATPAFSLVNGIVQLKGGMQKPGGNATPFVLPAGSRPTANVYIPVAVGSTNFGRILIDTAGNVSVMDDGGGFANAPQFTSLENASFAINATGFTALTLQNGWLNAPFGTRSAAVTNDNGTIRFQGAVASGTSSVLFTLPAGFRPPTDVYVPVGLCDAAKGRLHITPSGTSEVQAENSAFNLAQCFTSLEGATFALSASGYTAATLQSGWVNAPFSTRSLEFKNDDGILRLEGAIGSGTTPAIFQLPPNLRPAKQTVVAVDLCNAARGQLLVTFASGTVQVNAKNSFGDAACFTSLEGVSFGLGQ